MRELIIEWKHLDINGDTCDRCYDTGENLTAEVKRLNRSLNPKGISVIIKEVKLDDNRIPESNTVYFNGIPIEVILNIRISENYCETCSDMLGKKTLCRTVVYEGNEYEDIPAKAIREAAYKYLGLSENTQKRTCDCKGKGCC